MRMQIIFCETVQTLSKPENLLKFHRKYFDAVCMMRRNHTRQIAIENQWIISEPEFTLV